MEINYYNVIIIGSGPAGCSAAIYAARSGLKTAMICGNAPGGQLTITTDVENYPGFKHILGPDLMFNMIEQCKALAVDIIYEHVEQLIPVNKDNIEQPNNIKFLLKTFNEYYAEAIILATGASAKWLGLPNETKLRQNGGVSGCATCDGMFYKNKEVAVIGGGNSAAEEALFLANLASKVYIVHRKDKMRCEQILFDRILKNPKIHIIWNSIVEDMLSGEDNKLSYLLLKDIISNKTQELKVEGAFIAIGHTPNSQLVSKLINIDSEGYIITEPNSTKTSMPGIFAAGDVQDKVFRQAITAAGTGCMAALEALKFIENNKN
ncbi:MAG: thioredoxin-disulfide reductase [Rickettsiales bacterium]